MTISITRYRTLEVNIKQPKWTREEDALLAEGFLDADLEGEELRDWLLARGSDRTVGAIDNRLQRLNFFVPREKKKKKHDPAKDRLVLHTQELARQQLHNQITAAKLEAPLVPPFKKGELEW